MSEIKLLFPEALRKARKEENLSQTELAEKVGVSLMSIRRYENGTSFPDMRTLGILSIILQKEYLTYAWTNSWAEMNKGQEVPDFVKRAAYEHILSASEQKFLLDLVRKGNGFFLHKLFITAQMYLNMSKKGIDKANETIELLSKIPEYHAKKTWAYSAYNDDGLE